MDHRNSDVFDRPCHIMNEESALTEAPQSDTTHPNPVHQDTYPHQDPHQHPLANHHCNLSFPVLDPDGSIVAHNLALAAALKRRVTPPAALSTLGVRAMADATNANMTDSTNSLAESQYDMVDDMSELGMSNDEHETASIASTDHDVHEIGELTPAETSSIVDVPLEEDAEGIAERERELMQKCDDYIALHPHHVHGETDEDLAQPCISESQVARAWAAMQADSYLSDDLETPRQSTLPSALFAAGRQSLIEDEADVSISKKPQHAVWALAPAVYAISAFVTLAAIFIGIVCGSTFWPSTNPIAEVAIRREALHTAVSMMGYSADAIKTVNIEHLLPQPSFTTNNFYGTKMYTLPATVQYICSQHHVIISFPKRSDGGRYASPKSINASRGRSELHLQLTPTKLIEGIYDYAVDPSEAYGTIHFNIITKSPSLNSTAVCNFGSRVLQRNTYSQAGTALSKSVNKEMAVAADCAKSLSEKLHLELNACALATKNVTIQLALRMAGDIEVFARSAVAVMGQAAQASNRTVTSLHKDLMLAQKDLIKLTQDVHETLSTTAHNIKALVPSRKTLTSPLKLSRERALGFQQKLIGQFVKDKKSMRNSSASSITTDVSTYLHGLLQPLEAMATRGTLRVKSALRCRDTGDMMGCLQKEWKKTSSSGSLAKRHSKGLSTVPGHTPKSYRKFCSKGELSGMKHKHVKAERKAKKAADAANDA